MNALVDLNEQPLFPPLFSSFGTSQFIRNKWIHEVLDTFYNESVVPVMHSV
jgi:hypothetical protein